MELKVFKDTIASYGGRWETRLELPVETEILIPDYLPAVFKIVKCLIAPVVLQNRVAGGRWQVEGYLRCTVFYQSEEPGTRLLRTEQKFAFEKSVELPAGQYAEGPAQVWGEPEYCNCRAVSEHRIDLRGAYILCAAVAVRKELELLTSLADCGIEQYTRTMQGLQCAVTEEKTLTAETVAALPGAGESVLDITGSFAPGGVTLATGQASVQGTLQIQICSQNADSGELTVRSKELPIQQNLELPGAAEDDTALVRGEVLACTLSADDGAGEAALTVTWKLRVEVWRSVQYSVVADAYSTLCKTQTVQTVCRLLQQTTALAGRIPISIEDDLPDADGTVLGCFVTLGALCAAPAEGDKAETHLRLSGKGTAHVTSANAVKIVKELPNKNIFFIPDRNLAHFVADHVPGKNFVYNNGFCPTHERMEPEDVAEVKRRHPGAQIVAHGECRAELLAMADYVGSTSGIIQYVTASDCQEFIVCTEEGVGYKLKEQNPEKTFYYPDKLPVCPNMKKNTLEKVLHVLQTGENEVHVDAKLRENSKKPLEKMLELAAK